MRAFWRAPVDSDATTGGFSDAAENLQQRALPGTVPADDADDFAAIDLEGDVFERPEFFGGRRAQGRRRR